MPLMKFPREIRRMIFKFLLVQDNQIELPTRWSSRSPEIFRVCKEIKDETYSIFYRLNTFEINLSNYNSSLFRFTAIQPYQACLRHVKLCIGSESNIVDILGWLKNCTGLTSLTVRIDSIPGYRNSHKPDVFRSLKFKKPPTLKDISVQTRYRRLFDQEAGDLERACEILLKILEDGQYKIQASVGEPRKKRKK